MKNQFSFLFVLLVLVVACSNTNGDSDAGGKAKSNVTISGEFSGGAGMSIYLQYLSTDKLVDLDTIVLEDDGKFKFKIQADHPGYYRIGSTDANICVLIVYPEDQIEVEADANDIYRTYRIKGSKESERLRQLNKILAPRDSINMALQRAQMTQDQAAFQEVVSVFDQIVGGVVLEVKSFIDEDPGSLSALAAIQNLSMDEDMETYMRVIQALEGKVDGNEYYQVIKTQVEQQGKLAIGSLAPEISLPQPNGEVLNLSDLHGQYVLIDFWASWCGPCRQENPNVVKVYEKYHSKGFEILGVSLDKNMKAWLNAVEQDGLKWRQVSDLKYWGSAVVPEYSIKGIPLTFLIDPEGKIIAKNLRGTALEQKLAEVFSN